MSKHVAVHSDEVEKNIDCSFDQLDVINKFKRGHNIFLSGEPGTGKSWVIRELCKDSSAVILAPTGIAAQHIGGITIHRCFALPYGPYTRASLKVADDEKLQVIADMQIIIIDEISMVPPDLLRVIEYLCRIATNKFGDKTKVTLPFAGKQIVVVGDFCQLPPVIISENKCFYYENYGTAKPFVFHSNAWKSANFIHCHLSTNHRQVGEEQYQFLSALQKVRVGEPAGLKFFDDLINSDVDDDTLVLAAKNRLVDMRNLEQLEKLFKKQHQKQHFISNYSESLPKLSEEELPAPHNIELCEGARVMTTINNPIAGYVNGSIGTVIGMTPEHITVLLDCGPTVEISPYTWFKSELENFCDSKRNLDSKVFFTQLPIKFAWALTIHKAQGLTCNKIHINLDYGCFEHGQLYVALSRCTHFSKMTISRKLRRSDLRFSKVIKEFLGNVA